MVGVKDMMLLLLHWATEIIYFTILHELIIPFIHLINQRHFADSCVSSPSFMSLFDLDFLEF